MKHNRIKMVDRQFSQGYRYTVYLTQKGFKLVAIRRDYAINTKR